MTLPRWYLRRVILLFMRYDLSVNTSVRAGMTLAAQEIAGPSSKVIDAVVKYGYDSPGSFTKAFQDLLINISDHL